MELHRGKNLTSGPRPESVGTSRQVSRPDSVWGLEAGKKLADFILTGYKNLSNYTAIPNTYKNPGVYIPIIPSWYNGKKSSAFIQILYKNAQYFTYRKRQGHINTAATASRFFGICYQEAGIKTIFIAEFHCLHRLLTLSIKR